jgi:hypothetical protein
MKTQHDSDCSYMRDNRCQTCSCGWWGQQAQTYLSLRPVEVMALRMILIEYARLEDNVQTWEDILTSDTVTLSALMLKLMPSVTVPTQKGVVN